MPRPNVYINKQNCVPLASHLSSCDETISAKNNGMHSRIHYAKFHIELYYQCEPENKYEKWLKIERIRHPP